jgi:hypothetical protein
MISGGGADLILQFRLERGGDGMKCSQKMKQCGDVAASTGGEAAWGVEETTPVWDLTEPKNKENSRS